MNIFITNILGNDEIIELSKDVKISKFMIYLFGMNNENENISLIINDFNPYFYINIPKGIEKNKFAKNITDFLIERIIFLVEKGVSKFDLTHLNSLVKRECKIEEKKNFMGYTEEKINLLKLTFRDKKMCKYFATKFGNIEFLSQIKKKYTLPDSFLTTEVYDEIKLENELKFFHNNKINPSSWIHCNIIRNKKKDKKTKNNIEIVCKIENILPVSNDFDQNVIPKLKMCSYDIECYSHDGLMPHYSEIKNEIIQIGLIFKKLGENQSYKKIIIVQKKSLKIDDILIIECENEKELLLQYGKIIEEEDPDLIYGYNIFGFDDSYIFERAKMLKIDGQILKKISRCTELSSTFTELFLSSSGLGDNQLKYLSMNGRVSIDILKEIQKNVSFKFDSYKLDDVSFFFLKERKKDLSPQEIFKKYRSGTPEEIREIAIYCVQDCELVHKLVEILAIVYSVIGMAQVCRVSLNYIIFRGQGIKILSLLAYEMKHSKNQFIIKFKIHTEDGSYIGAIVLAPRTGIYGDEPVFVLDFNSLYPSIMIAHNISCDTILLNQMKKNENFDKLTYYDKIKNDSGSDEYKNTDVYFQKYDENRTNMGLIPLILQKLLKSRKDVNYEISLIKNVIIAINYYIENKKLDEKLLKNKDLIESNKIFWETNENKLIITTSGKKYEIDINKIKNIKSELSTKKEVLNALQLAFKITANSVYGQCGSPTSSIYCKSIASIVTSLGQKYIKTAKEYIEKKYTEYNAECIYGDSVTGDTPVIVRNSFGIIEIKTIDSLISNENEWYEYKNFKINETNLINKQQARTTYEIWTNDDMKWSKINRVIRHKTNKKIFSVGTGCGFINVTEDHSLITENMKIIKPEKCKIYKTKLMQSFPDNIFDIEEFSFVDDDDIWFAALFTACGRCEDKNKIKINKITKENLNLTLTKFKSKFIHSNYHIHFTGLYYDFEIEDENFYKHYHEMFYINEHKILPKIILGADKKTKKKFIDLFLSNFINKIPHFNIDEGCVCQGIYYLMHILEYKKIGILYNEDEFKILNYKNNDEKNLIYYLSNKNKYNSQNQNYYVYDLETDSGIFQAGIGKIVIKNTDSIFVKFNFGNKSKMEKLEAAQKFGTQIADEITRLIDRTPLKIAYEKTIFPLILMGKKNYCGLWYENDLTKGKFKMMGCAPKKRNYAKIVFKMFIGIINKIIYSEDLSNSLYDAIKFLYLNLLPINLKKYTDKYFVITKNLKKEYKKPLQIAHKILADKIAKRDPGNAPLPNDRIPFIFIKFDPDDYDQESLKQMVSKGGQKKLEGGKEILEEHILSGFKIETPDYIKENELDIDYETYIIKQICNPIINILRLEFPLQYLEYFFYKILKKWNYQTTKKIKIALTEKKKKMPTGEIEISTTATIKKLKTGKEQYTISKKYIKFIDFINDYQDDINDEILILTN